MHFSTKSYLKSTRNHTAKHAIIINQQRSLQEIYLSDKRVVSTSWRVPGIMSSDHQLSNLRII